MTFEYEVGKIIMQYSIFVICVTDEEADVPAEAMIPKYQLQDLCSEAAKLKTLGAMESVPPDRLVRLLNILEKNIRDGTRVSPIADPVSILNLYHHSNNFEAEEYQVVSPNDRLW
jgi:hypothetical protein